MKFVSNERCSRFYPYLELLGVFVAAWTLLNVARRVFNIDDDPPPSNIEVLFVGIIFALGWITTFVFLNKNQFSIKNTAIVALCGAFAFYLYAELNGIIRGHGMAIIGDHSSVAIGEFIICFIFIFFWGVVFQLIGTFIAFCSDLIRNT